MALRMAFAIFLWFLGRRPVALAGFMRPVSVMYSDMMVKFCSLSAPSRAELFWATDLVLEHRVDTQDVESVTLGPLAACLPFLLLGTRKIGGRVDVAWLPLAVYLALELAPPLRLDHLTRLGWAVEASFAGKARHRGPPRTLGCGGTAGGAAAAEDGEQGLIWERISTGRGGGGAEEA
jgi:hypothetical protein